jgi:outer membrane protein assembly factor BamB
VADCEVKAITLATGAVAWTVPVKEGGTTNCGVGERMVPMVSDGAVFATTYDGSIAIEAATGAVRWRAGISGGFGNGGGAIANGVWVLSAGDYSGGQLAALDLRTGEVLWQRRNAIGAAYLTVAGDLLVGRSSFALYGFDLLTGEKVWDAGQVEPTIFGTGGATIANGRIFVATRDGISAYGPP